MVDSFTVLGYGNGFPVCVPRVDDVYLAAHPTRYTDFTHSLADIMQIFWMLKSVSLEGTTFNSPPGWTTGIPGGDSSFSLSISSEPLFRDSVRVEPEERACCTDLRLVASTSKSLTEEDLAPGGSPYFDLVNLSAYFLLDVIRHEDDDASPNTAPVYGLYCNFFTQVSITYWYSIVRRYSTRIDASDAANRDSANDVMLGSVPLYCYRYFNHDFGDDDEGQEGAPTVDGFNFYTT